MNKYETIIIIDPKLDDEACAGITAKFTDMIAKEGEVESTEVWGRRKLAYPIQKNNEGYYVLINFSSNPEFIDELNRIYNITDEIIKHIIVKKED
ncbi:MAG: 30S ribosomal protein S6 [Clostridia bacterium]|nr:30S ribosomal protein S6 [Clostridia bacterium]